MLPKVLKENVTESNFEEIYSILSKLHYDDLSSRTRKIVRERFVEIQKGNCYFCGKNLTIQPERKIEINWSLFPIGFDTYPVHLHHCHENSKCLGAVHAYCNAILWQYFGE